MTDELDLFQIFSELRWNQKVIASWLVYYISRDQKNLFSNQCCNEFVSGGTKHILQLQAKCVGFRGDPYNK